MRYYQEPAKDVPVIEADIFVAGAGTAGCMAAIAAARSGARVVLIEKLPVPTGTMGNGGNTLYCFYNTEYDPDKAVRIVGGLPFEFYKRCVAEGVGYDFIATPNSAHADPYIAYPNREGLKGVLCMMLQEAGVKVLLQTMLVGVVKDGERIQYALIENKDGRSAVSARVFIDCSGDADIAKYAGLETVSNWSVYDQVCGGPTSLNFGLGGVDFERACKEAPDVISEVVIKDDKEGYMHKYKLRHTENPERCRNLCALDLRHFTNIMSLSKGEATTINNSKGPMIDASTAENLSKAEMSERIRVMRMAAAMKKDLPGFEHSHMNWAAIQLGIRSSRIVVCDKMLTNDEVSQAKRFDDEIGLYGFQDMVEKVPSSRIQPPGYYGLPYRMLLPKGALNLFVAGRCVTHDLLAHNSTRNTVSCMVMGQAAGVAAGICIKDNCDTREVPYAKLRSELLAQDVILNV